MHKKIKALADEALELQNKDRMDEALREIVAICADTDEALLDSRRADAGATAASASIANTPGFSATMMGFADDASAVISKTAVDSLAMPQAEPAPATSEEGGAQ